MYQPHTLSMALAPARAMRRSCAIIVQTTLRSSWPLHSLQFLFLGTSPSSFNSWFELGPQSAPGHPYNCGSATNVLTISFSSFSDFNGPLRRWLVTVAEKILQATFSICFSVTLVVGSSRRLGPPKCQIVRPSLGPPNRPSDLLS